MITPAQEFGDTKINREIHGINDGIRLQPTGFCRIVPTHRTSFNLMSLAITSNGGENAGNLAFFTAVRGG